MTISAFGVDHGDIEKAFNPLSTKTAYKAANAVRTGLTGKAGSFNQPAAKLKKLKGAGGALPGLPSHLRGA